MFLKEGKGAELPQEASIVSGFVIAYAAAVHAVPAMLSQYPAPWRVALGTSWGSPVALQSWGALGPLAVSAGTVWSHAVQEDVGLSRSLCI